MQPFAFSSRRAHLAWLGCLAALSALALFLFLFQCGQAPYGWHIDEAGAAYDAWCLVRGGTDRYGLRFPIYFINYGGGQNALYTYCAALLMAVSGRNGLLTLRLPAALFGLALLWALAYLLARRFGPRCGLLGAALSLCLPYFIMRSRFGLESLLMLPTLAVGLALLVWALDGGPGRFVLAGLALGLSLYTYALDYIVLPVFLLLALGWLLWLGRLRPAQLVALALPLGLLALPLMLLLAINSLGLPAIETALFTIPRLPAYRGSELGLISLQGFCTFLKSMLYCDQYRYNSLEPFGVMYRVSIPFVLAGLVLVFWRAGRALRRRAYSLDVLICALFLAFLAMVLSLGPQAVPNCNHINGIYLCTFYMLFSALHALALALPRWVARLRPALAGSPWLQRCGALALALVYGVCFLRFCAFYYLRYPAIDREYPEVMMYRELSVQEPELLYAVEYAQKHGTDLYIDLCYPLALLSLGIDAQAFRPLQQDGRFSTEPAYQNFHFIQVLFESEIDPDGIYLVWDNDTALYLLLQNSGLFHSGHYGNYWLFVSPQAY